MYQLHNNNIVCVTASALLAIMPAGTYKSHTQRGSLKVVQRACRGKQALVDFNTIPQPIKMRLVEKLGPQPELKAVANDFKALCGLDADAMRFFSNYQLEDGRLLPQDVVREYATNANLLNGIAIEYTNFKNAMAKAGKSTKGYWPKRAAALKLMKNDPDFSAHSLLYKNGINLQRLFAEYMQEVKDIDENGNTITRRNYAALVSKKYGNSNSLKVDDLTERVLMALYTQGNRPFARDVYNDYTLFVKGKRDIIDMTTGEVFDRSLFKPISEATVKNWLKNGFNEVLADSMRMGFKNFNDAQRPFMRRKAPLFAFSKLSMDDRDLPRKLASGKRVKAYYAYDVASGCVIGYAHSQSKDEQLFLDCLHNAFATVYGNNWNMPAEVEVENHLVNKFNTELQVMFPFLTVCAPMNSQQKRAEHLNRSKKYGAEKKLQGAIGRWWAKGKAFKIDQDWVNGEFVGKAYSFGQLVADDIEAIRVHNNELHPKQDLYPGLTRWQVLQQCQNQDLKPVNRALVAKCVGYQTNTTIMRNQAVQVQHAHYRLPNLNVLNKLEPGNKKVQAYYLPAADGTIGEVYVYQGNTYIGCFELLERYQEAKAERTAKDNAIMHRQFGYVAAFDAQVKRAKEGLMAIAVTDPFTPAKQDEAEQTPVAVVSQPAEAEEFDMDMLNFDADAIRTLSKRTI